MNAESALDGARTPLRRRTMPPAVTPGRRASLTPGTHFASGCVRWAGCRPAQARDLSRPDRASDQTGPDQRSHDDLLNLKNLDITVGILTILTHRHYHADAGLESVSGLPLAPCGCSLGPLGAPFAALGG